MNDQLPPTTLTVAGRTLVADGVVCLTLRRPDGGPLPSWTPGAHIDVLLDGDAHGLIRQYSLCGHPADRGAWQIAVLREPQGRGGSAHVHDQLLEGADVRVRGPRNNFPLRPADRHLFIAGGVGITPILPMVEAAEAAGADWRLLYGGRTRTSMAFLDRLAPHGDRVLVRPQDEYGLLDLAAHLGTPKEGTLVHACGPEPLLRAVQEQCAGWPPGTLGVERFAPVPTAAAGTAAATSFELELARSGLTLTVPPDRSVLETVEEAGVDVDFSCREGTCGTCETDVLEGRPDHRDSLLTEDERAAGDTMLICVSRSCGPRLVLDL
ncbi:MULTISPECIES: PDR/VanB family oxidoreductase [unclassified Streptomyces]|uniref:PDR/VanB family oxidoreductase n=1 Tax=unclassified Streptomyces TaxID=2593676 RepID=UPI002476EAF5|nr:MULTISPECIES: PDR/VanB family oxidoreductase [unclassified Streptomyces]MDH6455262.1 ferredoxin-NADP reductase [Streptomyces sp. SAI-119]MDH6494185.1 ferredoxin-NADP reductase [Streptomyces sp. SAI-149]